MNELRVFSYQPNPRLWKATIAARLSGVEIEVRGGSPKELQRWLWDFNARPLSEDELVAPGDVRLGTGGFAARRLHKTEAFLDAHPFGTAPAAFSPDGKVGIFESNSIVRAVARLGEGRFPLYGHGIYEASRVDGFLDASLIFGRDTQPYLVALLGPTVPADFHTRACDALATYVGGIERALAPDREFLVGGSLTIADICYACELTMLWYEKPRLRDLAMVGLGPVLPEKLGDAFPRAAAHFASLRAHPAFAPDLEPHLAKLESGLAVLEV